jgi:phosphoribosylglycinamide formyltransferase-1
MSRPTIAVLASGRGSNFDAILAATRSRALDAEIVAVVTDRPGAPVVDKARKAGIQVFEIPFPAADGQPDIQLRRQLHEQKVLAELAPLNPRFLVLAGYMRVMTPKLIEAFRSPQGYTRIINVHPSLLPAFPGVGSYAQAFKHGAKLAGVTVHLVEHEIDSGPICAQEAFSISACASAEDVERLGLAIEHRLYVETLSWVLPEQFTFERRGERHHVRPN